MRLTPFDDPEIDSGAFDPIPFDPSVTLGQRLRYLQGWLWVRPMRTVWHRVFRSRNELILWPRKSPYPFFRRRRVNLHWWLLGLLLPPTALTVSPGPAAGRGRGRLWNATQRAYRTYAWGLGECRHCGAEEGDQLALVDAGIEDRDFTHFEMGQTWSVSTMDGVDHRFEGTTVCPRCGYRDHYEDGSL